MKYLFSSNIIKILSKNVTITIFLMYDVSIAKYAWYDMQWNF